MRKMIIQITKNMLNKTKNMLLIKTKEYYLKKKWILKLNKYLLI